MRIAQVIDSLDVGGAEQMAVNYANALLKEISFSGLVVTRKEGNLKNRVEEGVDYLFLKRNKIIDWRAVFKLRAYCKKNKIAFLQPHSSSYFLVFLVKLVYPKIQIIWHDHNGLSEFLSSQKWIPLKIASFFFKGIIVVNYQLKNWATKELNCKQVIYFPNFTIQQTGVSFETVLKGNEGKRILCLANLRDQKNHFLLLDVAEELKHTHPEWSFHLVGKDFEDAYSRSINVLVIFKKLGSHVFLYGTRNDTAAIINQADLAILTSKSEGLPVSLLEYGLYGKPIVVTGVGEIPLIVQHEVSGFVVPSENKSIFYEAIVKLIESPELRVKFGKNLKQTILENHSQDAVIAKYLEWLNRIKNV
jgi:glycosyltransferase involved in cell wall biosynthesis